MKRTGKAGQEMTRELGGKIQLVGDDFSSCTERLAKGIQDGREATRSSSS